MASSNPPVKNVAWVIRVALQDMANPGSFKASPTLASGDFKVDIDGAGLNNLGTLPTVDPTGTIWVKFSLSASEMNGDVISIQAIDQTSPKEWADWAICVQTVRKPWLAPTTNGNDLDVSAGGEAGVDWANIGSPTTAQGLTGTTIATSQVVASVSGAVGSVTGAVGSVTGAVGSVTGNVGGNVVGSVGSVTGAVGSVTGNVGGNVVGSVASVTAGVTLAASAVQAIWDALTSALTTVGSIGKLLVTNIDATISSRSTYAGGDTAGTTTLLSRIGTPANLGSGATVAANLADIAAFIDTEVAAIKAKTDQLTFTLAGKVDSSIQAAGDFAQGAADKVWATATRTLTGIASGIIASGELNNIADALLKRDWTAVTGEAARSFLNAGRKLMNKVGFVAPTLTVYKEDDATPAYTQTVAQDAAQTPFKSLDTN